MKRLFLVFVFLIIPVLSFAGYVGESQFAFSSFLDWPSVQGQSGPFVIYELPGLYYFDVSGNPGFTIYSGVYDSGGAELNYLGASWDVDNGYMTMAWSCLSGDCTGLFNDIASGNDGRIVRDMSFGFPDGRVVSNQNGTWSDSGGSSGLSGFFAALDTNTMGSNVSALMVLMIGVFILFAGYRFIKGTVK